MAEKQARRRSVKVRHLDSFAEGMANESRRTPSITGETPTDTSPPSSPLGEWETCAAEYHVPSPIIQKAQKVKSDLEMEQVYETEDYGGRLLDTELQEDSEPVEERLSVLTSVEPGSVENKLSVIIQYWKQGQNDVNNQRPISLSSRQARKLWQDVEKTKEVESKERTVRKELHFIKRNFRQRRCKKFCAYNTTSSRKFADYLKKHNIIIHPKKFYCQCGLEKEAHSSESLSHSSTSHMPNTWSVTTHTEVALPWNFGNLDMPGNYSYLDLPQGTRKFLRLDDLTTHARHLWDLLTDYWQLRVPNLVISITGGDVSSMFSNPQLHKNFRDGIIKTAVNTKAWVITEGLYLGSSKEIGDIFQEDLKRSEWSEVGDHADIPLIAIGPWGVLAGQNYLSGIYVGSHEAKYNFIGLDSTTGRYNALDPYHTVYLLCDDGTHGMYTKEPLVRRRLESYIKTQTTIEMLGTKGVSTPVVILVLGGDTFTLQKVAEAVDEKLVISVVIVNGSGVIANMLADIFKALEALVPNKDKHRDRDWSSQEEKTLNSMIKTYEGKGLLRTDKDKTHLKEFMTARHLVTVFGTDDGDSYSLDKAILEATFGGIDDITAQLNLALAMDRARLAKETIFVESRKEELKAPGLVENALFVALEAGKSEFTQLLLDQDVGGEVNFEEFLTVKRLHDLHQESLHSSKLMGKVLRSLTKKDAYGGDALKEQNLLPQVGRIIYCLMGDNYRLLYQEDYFRTEKELPWMMCTSRREEAVWHIFLWAVLCNHKKIAEYFLFETDCKIGAALVAYKMLTEMSKVAEVWHESELVTDLQENAMYFQDLAVETLDNLYEMNREDAYATLVSVIPFHWGQYVTPLSIADDGEAKRFMGHACCQTFLNLLWMHYMDLDTSWWKLTPVFGLMPFVNIPFITFDKKNLAFGSYKDSVEDGEQEEDNLQESESPSPEENPYKGYDECSIASEVIEKPSKKKNLIKRLKFAWFCVQNYYTAPVNKFSHSLVTYMVFLGFFTHFVLSELRPIGSEGASEISVYEWLIYVWVFSISCQEMAQLVARKSSGPLYRLSWTSLQPSWSEAWHWHERMRFVFGVHKFTMWISDRWNSIDALMILMFLVSVILRFTLDAIDIGVVRICFCITLILFYVRLLRFGYILRHLGPRIVTIKTMMGDLFYFILILAVFIVSFGVAFQALLDPNQPPSWGLLSDVLWRSYWQMFGELLIDDATEGMGLPVPPRNCTSDRELAKSQPDEYEYCYNWMVPILLGVYMIITNILLLNLLIAIFSNSFEKIESESLIIWRYHLYDLVHEYYIQVWLPPPLNVLCHVANILLWCLKWPRRWFFLASMRRNRRLVHAELDEQKALGKGAENDAKVILRETEYAVKKECCSLFYYDNKDKSEEYVDHFRQEEYMRNEDLEEMAYKRYLRQKKKQTDKDGKIKDMLKQQAVRLQNITLELSQLKQYSTIPTLQMHSTPRKEGSKVALVNRSSVLESPAIKIIQNDVTDLNDKMDHLHKRLDRMATDIAPILDYVKAKSTKKRKSRSGASDAD